MLVRHAMMCRHLNRGEVIPPSRQNDAAGVEFVTLAARDTTP